MGTWSSFRCGRRHRRMIGSSRLETVFARTFVLHVTHHCRQKTCENDALSHAAVRLRGILVRERSEQLSKHLLQHLAHQISRRHRKHRLNGAANHLDTCVVPASADAGEARNLRGVVSMPLLIETQQRQQQRLAHRMQRLQISRSNGTGPCAGRAWWKGSRGREATVRSPSPPIRFLHPDHRRESSPPVSPPRFRYRFRSHSRSSPACPPEPSGCCGSAASGPCRRSR